MQHQARCLSLLLFLLACQSFDFRQIDDREIRQLPNVHRTLVLNFWATWCEPCVAEIPLLNAIGKRHPDATIVGISMDENKDEAKVREFIKQHKMQYQVYLRKGGEDFEAMVNSIDPNWIGGLPATFIYRNGKRIFSKTGQLKKGELERILESTS
jgi:thiol-disulfide isomerase/thioredoxin